MNALSDLESDIAHAVSKLEERLHLSGPHAAQAAGNEPLQPLAPRVFVINFDPLIDSAAETRLTHQMGWHDISDLIDGYIADVAKCSNGLVNYNVVGRVDVDEFPVKADKGFQYTPASYRAVMNGQAPGYSPDQADYARILADFHLLERVTANQFDEVWMFGGPYFGFWESAMAGTGAFYCNGGPIPDSPCPRKFVLMGFNYARGIGEMLESLGHRAETTLAQVYSSLPFWQWAYNRNRSPSTADVPALNALQRFFCFDQIAPGQSNVGTMHYAPNSTKDYEWGLPAPVQSCADDWKQFPNLPNPPRYRTVTAQDWGGGDIRKHHNWWFDHLSRAAGSMGGIRNNWWHYVADPNHVS